MEKQIITFSANEQCLQKTGGVDCYASNTVAYIEAHFDLGTNWSGYDSVRAVWSNDNNMTVISTVLDSNGVCVVPFEVLKTKGVVKVNLVGSISVSDVLTDRLTTFPCEAVKVTAKAKIEGSETQPITPSQFEQFVANVRADADRAEAGATSAETSAGESEASATASAQSATASANSASQAQTYAQNASESATSAENAKDDAEDARDKILGMRATAETLEAGSDATASYSDGLLTLGIPRGDKGEQGIQGETGATPSFSIGEVDTLEPNESATATITGTAENPVLNLGIPKGEQGDVNLSQLEALLPTETASGEIVTITDGQAVVPAKSLEVTLEPIQDLNGYDKPWSGGAGKNKLENAADSYSISGATYHTYTVKNLSSYSSKEMTFSIVTSDMKGKRIALYKNGEVIKVGNFGVKSVTATMPTLADTDTLRLYLQDYTADAVAITGAQLELGSTATSWTPYSNICPISGRTEVVTWDDPKYGGTIEWNQLLTNTEATRTINGITFTNNGDGTYTVNGTATADATFALSGGSGKPAHKVLLCGCPTGGSPSSYILWDGYAGWFDSGNGTVKPFANSGNWGILITIKSGITVDNIVFKPQLFDLTQMFGSTVADYIYSLEQAHAGDGVAYFRNLFPNDYYEYNAGETTCVSAVNGDPYNHHTTTLGRTVYGGTLDVVSGELTVTHAIVDMGTLYWGLNSGNRFTAAAVNNVPIAEAKQYANTEVANIICSQYATIDRNRLLNNGEISLHYSGQNYVNVIDTNYSDVASFKTAMSGVQLCYELATPQTIQLTPQEVQLLLGTNNVWSDGDVTLVYSADIQKWVEKKLSGNSTTSMLSMSRPMVQTETTETEETETETAETE